jgi:ABC-2 type transport system ATP-binding protein
VIETRNLTKQYGSFTAVEAVNMRIGTGEIYGFLGPNGAGKTTTVRMLLGVSTPTDGEVHLFGQPYTPANLSVRRRIGVVPERHPAGMWRWMRGYEYLMFFADLFEVPDRHNRIHTLLQQVALSESARKRVVTYSRGMLQKLSIVRALLHDPDLLLLDEPISGLDPVGIRQVRDLLRAENREGRTIFVSSHLLSEVEKLCDRVGIMRSGRLLAEDTIDGLLRTFSQEKDIHVELEHVPQGLPHRISELPFVRGARLEGDTLVITVPSTGDYRKEISRFLTNQDLTLLGLREQGQSLEDAFIRITKEKVEQLDAAWSIE